MSINAKKLGKFLGDNAIPLILLCLVIYVSFVKENFFSIQNFKNIFSNTSVRFIIALGVSGCLITKGTDLSAGRQIGLAGVLSCTLLQRVDFSDKFFPDLPELPLYGVMLFVILVGVFFGLLNGLIISYLKVPAFLATLGMQTIVYGINLVYSDAEPIGGLRKDYTNISNGQLFPELPVVEGIPYLIIIATVIAIGMWFLYNKTRHGKYMYAIGGNESAAEVSGINTAMTKIKIYCLAGGMYAFAGFLLAAKAGGASVNLGLGYELEAIAACTIGGVSTTGGVGKVQGILLGVLVFELMKVSLQFLGVHTSWQFVAQGVVIIVAVALDLRKYNAKK